jgi:hypothetical protein
MTKLTLTIEGDHVNMNVTFKHTTQRESIKLAKNFIEYADSALAYTLQLDATGIAPDLDDWPEDWNDDWADVMVTEDTLESSDTTTTMFSTCPYDSWKPAKAGE